MKRNKIVVFSGGGIVSRKNFEDYNKILEPFWKQNNPQEISTMDSWDKKTEKVLEACNLIKKALYSINPNEAYDDLVKLEDKNDVFIITTNVDLLHEKSGSSNVFHLFGSIDKYRSSLNSNLIFDWEKENDIQIGDLCEDGSQMKPSFVIFEKNFELPENLLNFFYECDIVIFVGASQSLFSPTKFLSYFPEKTKIYTIDTCSCIEKLSEKMIFIKEHPDTGLKKIVEQILNE